MVVSDQPTKACFPFCCPIAACWVTYCLRRLQADAASNSGATLRPSDGLDRPSTNPRNPASVFNQVFLIFASLWRCWMVNINCDWFYNSYLTLHECVMKKTLKIITQLLLSLINLHVPRVLVDAMIWKRVLFRLDLSRVNQHFQHGLMEVYGGGGIKNHNFSNLLNRFLFNSKWCWNLGQNHFYGM